MTAAAKGVESKHPTNNRPAEWNIGDDNCSGYFTSVPIKKDDRVLHCEVVVTVQTCRQDDEDSETENATKNYLALER